MRAWFQIKGNTTLEDIRIAVVVDVGEAHFSLWSQRLGAPAARYFAGTKEGEVVEVAPKMPSRVKKPEAA